MSNASLLLIRHAESVWNAAGLWQGHADPPLSARGRAQAERLAQALRGEPIDRLVASDLRRAAETARIVGRARGLEPRLEAGLRELDVGSWSGLTRAEIALRDADALARFEAGDALARAGGGETRRELRARVQYCIRALLDESAGARVALVAHLGVIRVLRGAAELANAQWCVLRPDAIAAAPAGALHRAAPCIEQMPT